MIAATRLIMLKDLRLCLFRSSGLVQAFLLGLLLIFLFSLSTPIGAHTSAQTAATIFWLATAFCQILIYTNLYSLEESQGQRQCLLLAPIPPQAIWLGKGIAGFFILFLSQLIFFPAIVVFLNQSISGYWLYGLGSFLLTDCGLAALGSLLGALAQGQHARESLLSIIAYPLLLPLFLFGINAGTAVFSGEIIGSWQSWILTGVAFNGLFISAGLVLFPFIYSADQ